MIQKLKISTLIVGVLSALMLLAALIGALGVTSARSTAELLQGVSLRDARSEETAARLKFLMESNRSQILQMLQHNPALEWSLMHDHPLDIHYRIIDDASAEIRSSWDDYLGSITSQEERALAENWYAKSGGLGLKAIGDATAFVRAGEWNSAQQVLIMSINPTYRAGNQAAAELTALLERRGAENEARVEQQLARTQWLLGLALLVALAIAAGAGWVLLRGITRPLAQAVEVARRVAAGDLTSRIEVGSSNELGVLMRALKEMNESLVGLVTQVRGSSDSIAMASSQIASGNADLSQRTEAQASNLQQTAASMEQMTGTVRNSADTARQASQLASSASGVAVQGGEVVGRVVTTMDEISAASKRIADIIGVIDGIAFQTNILALNAAVEAARAGEQGRGFAVVASEVRSLAQRSAQAAKEIKTLIGDSVEKVEAGSRLVGDAGRTMEDIVSQVRRVTDLINEISVATQEQSTGIGQVGQAVSQLDQMTQQNASLVEQSAAAAESLHQQASQMLQAVSVFKLDAAQAQRSAA